MSTRAPLKAAKSALDSGNYDEVITQSQTVLGIDGKNYFANLFLGRAFEKQGKIEKAAAAYHSASEVRPDDVQAWLGLCSLYESQGAKKVDEFRVASIEAAKLYASSDDRERCQTVIDKLISFVKQHGTRAQYKRALEVLLPGGPIYDFLEGRIQHPSLTYTRLVELTEDEESQAIKNEIATRRTRIGARIGQVTTDVKREVFSRSDLERLYQEVINWSTDDETRRHYEEKLLDHCYEVLVNLPTEVKASKLDQVLTLAEGMVIIHHHYQKAWDLVLETRDFDDLRDLDVNILREYVAAFADAGLGKIMKGWLTSELSPFPQPAKDEKEESPEPALTAEDRLVLLTEGLTSAEESPFAYRLVSEYYLHLEEHESAAETARLGLKALSVEAAKLGMTMQNTQDALNSVLATALVHHQAPRNHAEARRLFENILSRKPHWTAALIGLGLILEENEEYADAVKFLAQALEGEPSNVRVGTELAWCRALGGDYTRAQDELETYLQQIKTDDPRARDLKAQVLYRVGICMWEIDASRKVRKDREGAYSRFLAAIKANVNFAPAYTSLGVYYADYAKDRKRARQCFQKAFELSPAETNAAERLARSFADQGDWDIVEVVAQRVIDTGRARQPPGSKRKGLSWPYSALGVVLMNRQDYQKAITSFLAALRIRPDDYQSYIGLGESYHNSGRYNSALRTFNYALESHESAGMQDVEEKWFARYMLANVHRELGEYDEAAAGLESVLKERPQEFGVMMSLLQTFVEHSWRSVETGLYGQATQLACKAISVAGSMSADRPNAFNRWKAVGDACTIFSYVQSASEALPLEVLRQVLLSGDVDRSAYDLLSDIDGIEQADVDSSASNASSPVAIALLAYKRAIHACSHDVHAQAVAWYNLGWAEQRAYTCSEEIKIRKRYLKAAVRCFKRAIELEAGNAEFWNALGVVTSTLNPKVAQHSLVRSLHLNELNAKVWSNLGTLYLLNNDFELAHQAFGRAQSTDPDYAHAWTGEGLIAMLEGKNGDALTHFTHAFEIADAASTIVKRQYAISLFDHLLATPSASNDLTALVQPIFALEQLQRQLKQDLPYSHLAALYFERVGNHVAATAALAELCQTAEEDFEASESLTALARFAQAKSDLARNQLASQQFASAAENAETALDLSADADGSGLDKEARTRLRLSCHLTAGLALFNLDKIGDAVGMFKTALQESNHDPDVVCSLVKALWAQGGKEEKAVAREQLFECVEQYPEHVGAVTLLGAIAALEDDKDTTAAVKDDLVILRTKDGLGLHDRQDISKLLSALSALLPPSSGTTAEDAAFAEAQAATLLLPDQPRSWSELAKLAPAVAAGGDAQLSQEHVAIVALKTAQKSVPPMGSLEPQDVALAFAGVGSAGDAQRAVALAPWVRQCWESLADSFGTSNRA